MVPFRLFLAASLVLAHGALAQGGDEALSVYEGAWAHFDKGDHAGAIKLFEQAAGSGSAKAAHNLGSIYEDGKVAPQDRALALEWFRKGADLGSARSMHNIGVYHEKGLGGVAVDLAEAFKWYLKGAEGGLANSQYMVGLFYSEGKGVAPDEARALEYLRLAAGQGNEAARELAAGIERDMSGSGDTVSTTTTASPRPSPSPGAKAGPDPEKLFQGGISLLKKPGIGETDRRKALRMIAAAASRGHLEGQYTLGVIFIKGKGVPHDETRGRAWLKRAADKGHLRAVKALQVLDSRRQNR